MILIFSLFFKIIPPNGAKVTSNKKLIKRDYPIECQSKDNLVFENQVDVSEFYIFFCDRSADIEIRSCSFINCKLSKYSWTSFRDWSTILYFQKSNASINLCNFKDCKYLDNLVLVDDHDENNYFNFISNQVINCYHTNNDKSVNILSNYQYNDIENNNVTFYENERKARAFQITNHRGLKMVGNQVKNAYFTDSSAILCEQSGGATYELEFSDCIFTNSKGDLGAVIVIENLNYELSIKNLTIDYCKNEYDINRGYLIRISPPQTKNDPISTKLNILNCHFSYLETSAANGGGIGLSFGIPNNADYNKYKFELTFENTLFEHILSKYLDYGGGAISFTDQNTLNCNTKLTIIKSSFNNVTSMKGGGAIYFSLNSQELTIEDSNFTNTYTNGQTGGSILIELKPSSAPISIKGCRFENIQDSQYGGAIFVSGESGSNSNIIIEDCLFDKTKAENNGNSIMITQSTSDTISISRCLFTDCGTNQFSICASALNLNFINNQITFSSTDECCACIELVDVINCVFKDNLFKNGKYNDDQNSEGDISRLISGGIDSRDCSKSVSYLFENNTFDHFIGNNQGKSLCLLNLNENALKFINNTIQDCPEGGFLIKFGFGQKIIEQEIETLRMINNHVNNFYENSGLPSTPQISVENIKDQNGDYYEFNLIFKDCYFDHNSNTQIGGGALLYGTNINNANTKIILINCYFNENSAKGSGGALCIQTYPGAELEDCTFIKNKSEEGCGTIHFETNHKSLNNKITISRCKFEDNTGNQTGAILINDSPDSEIKIIESNFTDCLSKSFVLRLQSDAKSILVQNCTITFLIEDQSESAIYLTTDSVKLIGNTLKNFKNTVIRMYCIPNGNNVFEISENTFSKCSKNSILDIENAITNTPIIRGNIFEDVSLNEPSFNLKLKALSMFVFEENKFLNFQMNTLYGGIGIRIDQESKENPIHLKFTDCFFINDSNDEEQQKGGAIKCNSNQNNGNVELTLDGCYFERNHITGIGSAIYVNIINDVTIIGCTFIDNTCNDGTIYIDPDFSDSTQTSAVKISGCNFKKNQADEYSSIHISASSTKTINIENSIFDEEKGVFLDNIKNSIDLNGNYFSNIYEHSALTIVHPKGSNVKDRISIDCCTFDSCNGIDNSCFDIFINSKYFFFMNSVIKNNVGTGCSHYIGLINCNRMVIKLEFENVSFINNVCDSLYGGGIGLQIFENDDLTFTGCKFINNSAKQNAEISRPTKNSDKATKETVDNSYYNGDGGALQLGYICSMNEFDVTFDECEFKENHAHRHGGALALQTIKDVYILDCIFENNEANYNFDSSSELLVDNHFNKKHDGRGGAIYINPSYSYDDSSLDCSSPGQFFADISIQRCKFSKNNAFDGYAIYIEGDNLGSPIEIDDNDFINNYNETNYIENDKSSIYGAVIITEIWNIDENKVIENNRFSNELKVKEISFVDHYASTLTKQFTKSDVFTQSSVLPSHLFTNSKFFSPSLKFSNSKEFSESAKFTEKNYFTESNLFVDSNEKEISTSKNDEITITYNIEETSSENVEETSSENIEETSSENGDETSSENIEETSSESSDETSSENIEESSSENSNQTPSENNKNEDISSDYNNNEETSYINDKDSSFVDTIEASFSNIEETKTLNNEYTSINTIIITEPPSSINNADFATPKNTFELSTDDILNRTENGAQKKSTKSVNLSLVLGLVFGIIAAIVIIVIIIIMVIKKRRANNSNNCESQIEMDTQNQLSNNDSNEYENPFFNNTFIADKDPFDININEDDV